MPDRGSHNKGCEAMVFIWVSFGKKLISWTCHFSWCSLLLACCYCDFGQSKSKCILIPWICWSESREVMLFVTLISHQEISEGSDLKSMNWSLENKAVLFETGGGGGMIYFGFCCYSKRALTHITFDELFKNYAKRSEWLTLHGHWGLKCTNKWPTVWMLNN